MKILGSSPWSMLHKGDVDMVSEGRITFWGCAMKFGVYDRLHTTHNDHLKHLGVLDSTSC